MIRKFRSLEPSIVRCFHSSALLYGEQTSRSPLKVFYDTFKAEVKKSSELKEQVKALQDEKGRVADSETFRKAKEAFDKAQKGTSAAGQVAKQTADVVGQAAYRAWELPVGKGVRISARVGADVADRAFSPVRNTKVYQDVSELIDDGSLTQYGGFLTKEQREVLRERERQQRARLGYLAPVVENEDAGNAVVATESKASGPSVGEKWESFKERTVLGRGILTLQEKFDESENGLVALVRTVGYKVSGFFAETEQAKVIRRLKTMDPSFRITDFQKTLVNYIVPELLDAYIRNDVKVLKEWLTEAPFNVWEATNKQFVQQGLFSDSKILDIRGVEIVTCRSLQPNDVPVIVVTCRAQEVHLYRKAKTGEVAAGAEDHIQLSTYAMVLTRIPEEFSNKTTDGWKVVEFARGGSRPFH